nr:uncharacterized protein LOC129451455 [Misgurnus anguillicaudatus]
MDFHQTRILHLNLFVCLSVTSLTYADHSKSIVQKIQHYINRTAIVGDTVTLYCNKTLLTDDITWKMENSVIFRYESFSNKTLRNFTSDRMYTGPAVPMELKINKIQASDAGNYSCYTSTTAVGWQLTITENRSESLKQISHLYIIISCTAVIIICLIISLSIWIHRRWKNNKNAGHRETEQDFSQTPDRGGIETQNQSFERYNSLYGQL